MPGVGSLDAVSVTARQVLDVEAAWLRYGPSMVGLAMLLGASRPEAEDVVQDVFTAISRKPRTVADVEGYLRVAVVNRCRRHRQRETRPSRYIDQSAGDVSDDAIDTTLECVLMLKPRYRAAIVLRFYQDLSMAQVAAALGCRESTARSLVHRALSQLKEMLHER
jgi:RNA polymerase sigma factor (sigma-70 family)